MGFPPAQPISERPDRFMKFEHLLIIQQVKYSLLGIHSITIPPNNQQILCPRIPNRSPRICPQRPLCPPGPSHPLAISCCPSSASCLCILLVIPRISTAVSSVSANSTGETYSLLGLQSLSDLPGTNMHLWMDIVVKRETHALTATTRHSSDANAKHTGQAQCSPPARSAAHSGFDLGPANQEASQHW